MEPGNWESERRKMRFVFVVVCITLQKRMGGGSFGFLASSGHGSCSRADCVGIPDLSETTKNSSMITTQIYTIIR